MYYKYNSPENYLQATREVTFFQPDSTFTKSLQSILAETAANGYFNLIFFSR